MDPRTLPISYESALGAALVIAGVSLKNTMEKKGSDSMVGLVIFVIGWLIFANAITRNAANAFQATATFLPYLAAAIIVGSVVFLKQAMKRKSPKTLGLIGFIGGWLLLAFSINQNKSLAFGSAMLVFISMLLLLPKQRAQGLVDGPGWPLFVFAWVGLIIANADLLPKIQ